MQNTFLRIAFILWVIVMLSSCVTARRVNYLQYPDNIIPSYTDTAKLEDYRLRSGDKLFIRVYSTHTETNDLFNSPAGNVGIGQMGSGSVSDLYSYEIKPDGYVTFPMIGDVFMKGKTVREATAQLERAIEPLFQVSTVEIRVVSRYFSVIGSGRSGFFPMSREKINIFQALALAGDIGTFGDRSSVRIVRKTGEGTIIKKFDIRSRDILTSEFFYVEPDDVIYIQGMDEQFFGIQNLPSLFATTISTFSFGLFIFNFLFGGSN